MRGEEYEVQGEDLAVTLTCPRLPGCQCGRQYSIPAPGSCLEDLSLETVFKWDVNV